MINALTLALHAMALLLVMDKIIVSGFALTPITSVRISIAPTYRRSSCPALGAFSLSSKGSSDMEHHSSLRTRLRKVTGFSLTAVRATMRAATGISLTAIYTACLAATGAWTRHTLKLILSIFPAWARYFVQPILVLYYAPLFALRKMSSPSRDKEGKRKHDAFVESWKHAIEIADEKSSYWPLHLNEKGEIENDIEELDLNEAVAESIEVSMDDKTN
jgi:hypothetical protein